LLSAALAEASYIKVVKINQRKRFGDANAVTCLSRQANCKNVKKTEKKRSKTEIPVSKPLGQLAL